MSVWATNAVFQLSKQSGAKLTIMLALANYADDNGWCFPSVRALAEKCRLTPAYTRDLLAEMRTEGELEVVPRKNESGDNRSNLYHILLPGSTKAEAEQEKNRRGGYESFVGGATKDSPPESLLESSPDSSLQAAPTSPLVKHISTQKQSPSPHQEMVQALCDVCKLDGKLYYPTGEKETGGKVGSFAKKLLKAGYSPSWIREAFGQGGWWYYQHPRGKQGHSPVMEMIWMNVAKAKEDLGG